MSMILLNTQLFHLSCFLILLMDGQFLLSPSILSRFTGEMELISHKWLLMLQKSGNLKMRICLSYSITQQWENKLKSTLLMMDRRLLFPETLFWLCLKMNGKQVTMPSTTPQVLGRLRSYSMAWMRQGKPSLFQDMLA